MHVAFEVTGGSLLAAAGYCLKWLLDNRKKLLADGSERKESVSDLRGIVESLREAVGRLEGMIGSIPALRSDLSLLRSEYDTLNSSVRSVEARLDSSMATFRRELATYAHQIAAEFIDVRRSQEEMDSRLRVVEEPHRPSRPTAQ